MTLEDDILIIGNGIAGITTARHIRKRCKTRIRVISDETDHFFSRTALMYVYMGHMKFEHIKPYPDSFWKKNQIELVKARVVEVLADECKIKLNTGELISYTYLVIATGSVPNKFNWPGQDLKGVQCLYSYQDLQQLEENTHPPLSPPEKRTVKRAVIVGGGLIGVELAEMLATRDIQVTFLVRESRFWGNVLPKEEGELVGRHLAEHHIDMRYGCELKEILGDENGKCRGVITSTGEEIACEVVGLTAGVKPNVDFLRNSKIEIDRGVLVDFMLKTNIPNIFAAGDCVQVREPSPNRRAIEAVWYTGRMMGEVLGRTLSGEPIPYMPGIWFNSAKFFDIEYQTYGNVPAELGENQLDFYWESPCGKKCVKLVFDKQSRELYGVNVFGLRLRHEVLDRWLKAEKTVEHCLGYWKDAVFDPEFSKTYADDIVAKFSREHNVSIVKHKKNWMRILDFYNS